MNEQINLRLSPKLLKDARKKALDEGYSTVQSFIEEAVRQKLYERELTRQEMELVLKTLSVSLKKNLLVDEQELTDSLRKNAARKG
jgi:hypothetical protein